MSQLSPIPSNPSARPLRVVAVSGSLHTPSKTTALVKEILASFGRELPIDAHLIAVNEIGPDFAGALRRDELPASVEAELQRIESADLLVVASPVYRASFTGLFKHLFDFVGQYALVDTPVLIAATGGSDRHALIIEHQFRPLFGFFQALTLPIGIYANDSDFTNGAVSSLDLHERIDLAVARAIPLIRSNVAEAESIAKYLGR
ncbi:MULTISPECIES: FMN reductase [unclassified Leifsonia]|uniref:FMN reductase n=1 Tax=unclassified Leifsonia TaxID=2663824 RepID=UPI000A196CE1|nr:MULTISPECIES: FMN reductase [unclassified Leifsonia]QIZ99350.1 FMN reductase [Leifsonia sp. PS1209]